MTDNILKRREDESFNEFHIRLYENKEEYGIDKFKIADILNAEMGSNYDESKWRKDYAQYVKWRDFLVTKSLDKEIVKKHEELKVESEKEKIRKQDQKREYRNLIRNQARFEQLREEIVKAVLDLEHKRPLKTKYKSHMANSQKHGLSLWSDWHYDMICDNTINKYDKEIFDKRVDELVEKTIQHGKTHNISTLHIGQLGDLLSGTIHVSTRVQSNEDIIKQVQYVSETLAEAITRIASEFPHIKFYNVIGNHGRTGNKNDVGIKENFEYLIPWYLETRLRNLSNVEIISDNDGYIASEIFSQKVVFVHGNYDRVDQCVTRLPQMLGYVPSYIFGGHVHHNYEKEHGRTTVIVNGSLIGADDYAIQHRYYAKPSQKFMVFDENEGLECTYIIRFNN